MPEDLPIPTYRLMTMHISIIGSLWFTTAEGEDMARMAAAGTLDLSHLDAYHFPLEQANEAVQPAANHRDGGFASVRLDLLASGELSLAWGWCPPL
ncbi:hypothetical protein ABZV78_14570 [Micromonospora sp. NPDC004540]|uniref:hypothetical protein n=1 Tax=Micromonospora sp. NPDC004540 TaxID=3154457 RepID=UPI0033A71093